MTIAGIQLGLFVVSFLICHDVCAAVLTPTALLYGREREELVHDYFRDGYEYKVILCFLYFVHGICLSLRQLKRILKQLGLRRRGLRSAATDQEITELIKVGVSENRPL